MKKVLRYGVVTIVIVGVVSFLITSSITTSTMKSGMELGMKISDFQWLAEDGKISMEEYEEFQNVSNAKEMNEVLDKILKDKCISKKMKISFN